MSAAPDNEVADISLRDRLNLETATISWAELVRHFARGSVITVSTNVNLLTAAECIVQDDAVQLKTWIDSSELLRATDDHARDWTDREPEFWCVVTAPWVLVQEKQTGPPECG